MAGTTVVYLLILGTLVMILFVFMLILFLIEYKRRQQKHITEKTALQHQFENQLLQSKLEMQEQSFKYYSEEIHDNVGQILSVAKLYIHNLGEHCPEPEQKTLISKSTELISKALTDLRSISHTLNGNFINKTGLKEATQNELHYVGGAKSINCELEITGEEYSLSNEKELLVFRIIQEAMTNAIKHAQPSHIRVQFQYERSEFTVNITNDGKGFDNNNEDKKRGLGLDNMQMRAKLLQGNLDIRSGKENGTIVQLTITNENGKQ